MTFFNPRYPSLGGLAIGIIVPWLAFSTENIPYFKQIGPTTLLTVNFNQSPDKSTLIELQKALRQQKRKFPPPHPRNTELIFIEAMIHRAQNHPKEASELFQAIPPATILGEFAVYFEALDKKKAGEDALESERYEDSTAFCDASRQMFSELMGRDSPFQTLYKTAYYECNFCIAKGWVKAKKKEQAQEFIPTLLKQWTTIPPDQAEYLYKSLADIHLEDKKPDQARFLISEAKKNLLDPSWITLYEFQHPEIKSGTPNLKPTPSPEELLKSQKETESAVYVDTLRSQKKYAEALQFATKTTKELPYLARSPQLASKLFMVVKSALQDKVDFFSLLGDIKTLSSYHMYQIARKIWEDTYPKEAAQIFYQIYSVYPKSEESSYSLFFLARIYEDEQNWAKAKETLEKIVTLYPNTTFFKRSVFKLGWMSYLIRKEKDALRWLEHAKTLAEHPNDKAEANYWLYKTYLKLEAPSEASKYAALIEKESPLSYYSFLLGKFPKLTAGSVSYSQSPGEPFQSRIYLMRALFSVGLLDFAMDVLSSLDLEQDVQLAREAIMFYGALKKFRPSIVIAYNLIHENDMERIPKDLVESIFPMEFGHIIKAEAHKNHLDPELIFALIKQESAYEDKALSRSGAMGLMQLMPATAEHVAKSKNLKLAKNNQLFDSSLNVQLGAAHLKLLINRYKGNVAFALAAYNAGTTRVDQWVERWGNLPLEVFIELIPFDETRGYVKLILRNYAFYYFLNQKQLKPQKIFFTFSS